MSEMSIEANSDQINAEDFLAGPQTVTVTGRLRGNTEQPVWFEIAEFPGRTYRPGKTMRRLMVAAWGPNPEHYIGRRMTLYNDPEVRFGKSAVGGIRISHMSHIAKPVTANLMVSRGKRAPFTVMPLEEVTAPLPAPEGWRDDVAACESVEDLTEFYEMASAAGWWGPEIAAACTARKAAIHDAGS